MGFKSMLESIQKNYEQRKVDQLNASANDIAKGSLVEKFLDGREFEIVKGVFEKLEQDYDALALESGDVKHIAKKQVFKEVLDELVLIVNKAKKLDELNRSNYKLLS